MNLLVVTDLDGTLLDHATYDWQPAAPALQGLKAQGVPVILASSKTAAEMRPLQQELGLTGLPAIVENGAGIMGTAMTPQYDALRSTLAQLPKDLRAPFRGFGDMSVQEVVALTGLPMEAAQRAKARHFSEPGVYDGPAEAAFVQALAQLGVSARRGGRFLTLSFGRTKADAMRDVAEGYRGRRIIALGDAPNDAEMLEAADIGIIIRNEGGPTLPALRGDIRHSTLEGPAGWNEMVHAILEEMTA